MPPLFLTSTDFLADTTASTRSLLTFLTLLSNTYTPQPRRRTIPSLYFSLVRPPAPVPAPSTPRRPFSPSGTTLSILAHVLILDASLLVLKRMVSAPHVLVSRYLACPVTALVFYCPLQICFSLAQLAAYLNREDVGTWRPLFVRPWVSTSISDFWGRRWHQLFRHAFTTLAYKPLARKFRHGVLRRVMPVCGVFALSGVCHMYIMYTAFDDLSPSTFMFFMIHAAGSIFETFIESYFQNFIPRHPVFTVTGWCWFVSFFTTTGPLFLSPFLTLARSVNTPVSMVGWLLGLRPLMLCAS
ncbi:long-chain-alcohol O-fatty-acyltransferase [Synchytrium endobioticum]|nr:long-chain-alcohol O-fatty-acyltransferase [Synchytrium endobioticum]